MNDIENGMTLAGYWTYGREREEEEEKENPFFDEELYDGWTGGA